MDEWFNRLMDGQFTTWQFSNQWYNIKYLQVLINYFTEYILNPNPEERPDIFQVSWVAFKLMGKDTPILNAFVSILTHHMITKSV